jgi:hypothetical protein
VIAAQEILVDGFCGGGAADVDSFAAGYSEVPRLRARDYAVTVAPFSEARAFIVEHHYARGASNTASVCHGLYRGGATRGRGALAPADSRLRRVRSWPVMANVPLALEARCAS